MGLLGSCLIFVFPRMQHQGRTVVAGDPKRGCDHVARDSWWFGSGFETNNAYQSGSIRSDAHRESH